MTEATNLASDPAPWTSIRSGVVPLPMVERSYADSLASPCATCTTSPCCTFLPLTTQTVSTISDLSHLEYLLNFENIRLGVNVSGDWSVYYTQPCRLLDLETGMCTVHATPDQPNICQNYDPHHCWYRRNLPVETAPGFLQVDRTRLRYLLDHVTANELREITSHPDWAHLQHAFAGLSDEPLTEVRAVDDSAYTAWKSAALGDDAPAKRLPLVLDGEARSIDDLGDPCDGCSAPCCETLEFPQEVPTTRAQLDYLKFALGFPGIELVVAHGEWKLAVRTRCRHLVDGRCSVYGQPERPLECGYYDAYKCTYRVDYGAARPPKSVRIRHETFPTLVRALAFDELGDVLAIPAVDDIRAAIERQWGEQARTEVAAAPVPS